MKKLSDLILCNQPGRRGTMLLLIECYLATTYFNVNDK